jgi:hypothetical protein
VPAIFIIVAVWFIFNTLVEKPLKAGISTLIIGLGVPVYYLWRR